MKDFAQPVMEIDSRIAILKQVFAHKDSPKELIIGPEGWPECEAYRPFENKKRDRLNPLAVRMEI